MARAVDQTKHSRLLTRACPRASLWRTWTAMQSRFLSLWLMLATLSGGAEDIETYAQRIAPLIDPVKLATLKERGANPRVQKYVVALAEARLAGLNPDEVAAQAVKLAGYTGDAATLTVEAMTRNLTIATRLGSLTAWGRERMRRGNAAKVENGPYNRQVLTVDHIIPRAVAPELDNVIANLELMPSGMNAAKGAKIGDRQRSLARKLHAAGLLSAEGLKIIEETK